MYSLVAFLDKLFFFLQKLWKQHNEKKWQKEQDELEASPADWFEHHFDGLPTLPTDDKAKQANIESK
jgi:hypothetical protein